MHSIARRAFALSYLVACSQIAGCGGTSNEGESFGEAQQELDTSATKNLTLTQGTMAGVSDEAARESDTAAYYASIKVGVDGLTGRTANLDLRHFYDFYSRYGFGQGDETIASYYNRGDLGIGREMHCIDRSSTTGQIACYVRNYAAGDDNTPFTFGLSHDIAFRNMLPAGSGSFFSTPANYFAIVAMVFRSQATVANNRVFFLVYDDQDLLTDAAALDRVGIAYNTAFRGHASLTGLGTPGANFNNHIPSNCISCHGGQPYNTTNGVANTGTKRNQIGSLFLPFDLNQFDYDATNAREPQQAAFRTLNQMVRNVAVGSGYDFDSSLRDQVDGWYRNTSHAPALSGSFNSSYLPSGWDPNHVPDASKGEVRATPGAPAVYRDVIRSACRNCHVVNDRVDSNGKALLHFDTEANFVAQIPFISQDLLSFRMPHSLQSIRNFWQSSQPIALRAYAVGLNNARGNLLNNTLLSAGPGNVATLDPPAIMATLVH